MSVRRMFSDLSTATTAAESLNFFQSKLGHVVTNKATEFVVIDDFGCSPSADWSQDLFSGGVDIFMNVRINTTMYFTEPDGSPSQGVRGLLNPYPESNLVYKRFVFEPKVYVLPGQSWDLVLSHGTLTFDAGDDPAAVFGMVVWTMFDGVDCVVANKLLEMGVDVSVANVDWYKRTLVEKRSER